MTLPRFREAAARFAERRQREAEAPRLRAVVPRLVSLRLDVEERRGTSTVAETKHVRHVVVEHAPALFYLACGDSLCRDGGHDITNSVMRYLQSGATSFSLEDECLGSIGTAQCGRIVRVTGTAVYGPATGH